MPDEDVAGHAEPEKDRSVGKREIGQMARALDEYRGKAGGDQHGRGYQAEQLSIAFAHFVHPPELEVPRTRFVALVCERRSSLNSEPRRSAGTSDAGMPET